MVKPVSWRKRCSRSKKPPSKTNVNGIAVKPARGGRGRWRPPRRWRSSRRAGGDRGEFDVLAVGRLFELVDQRRHFLARRGTALPRLTTERTRPRTAPGRARARRAAPSALASCAWAVRHLRRRAGSAFLRSGETTSIQPAASTASTTTPISNDAVAAGHRATPPVEAVRGRRAGSRPPLARGRAACAPRRRRRQRSKVTIAGRRGRCQGSRRAGAAARAAGLGRALQCHLLTPSIRRRRSSIWATAAWLVAQPLEGEGGDAAGRRGRGDGAVAPSRRCGGRERGAAPAEPPSRGRRPIVPVHASVSETSGGQHAAELVEGVRPVEARVDERRDGLLALFAQRDEARVGRELRWPAACARWAFGGERAAWLWRLRRPAGGLCRRAARARRARRAGRARA